MTIAAFPPDLTASAASMASGLLWILSHAQPNGEYITVWVSKARTSMGEVTQIANANGMRVVNNRHGVASVWKDDTLFGVWHKSVAKIYPKGVKINKKEKATMLH